MLRADSRPQGFRVYGIGRGVSRLKYGAQGAGFGLICVSRFQGLKFSQTLNLKPVPDSKLFTL